MRRALARHGLVVVVTLAGMFSSRAYAQVADPNPGNITLTAGVDFPTVYVFRGFLRESDPAITAWPVGDVGIAFYSGDGGLKHVGVNFGLWNSLHTGSSGSDGPTGKLWYEEDFYTTLTLGFGWGTSVATTYTAYTSPNGMFRTVKEVSFKASLANRIAPYGLVAFELEGQADRAINEGTYLELGVGPSWPLGGGRAMVAIPVKLGLSLSDYYELRGEDKKFGFFDIGALVTVPFTAMPTSFGSWNFHAGVDFFAFGDTTEFFNEGDSKKVIGLVGIGVSY